MWALKSTLIGFNETVIGLRLIKSRYVGKSWKMKDKQMRIKAAIGWIAFKLLILYLNLSMIPIRSGGGGGCG